MKKIIIILSLLSLSYFVYGQNNVPLQEAGEFINVSNPESYIGGPSYGGNYHLFPPIQPGYYRFIATCLPADAGGVTWTVLGGAMAVYYGSRQECLLLAYGLNTVRLQWSSGGNEYIATQQFNICYDIFTVLPCLSGPGTPGGGGITIPGGEILF